MKIVHFIVNPIAGKGKPIITDKYLSKYFPNKDYQIIVKYSEYKGHAKLLTKQSVKEKAEIIVACGGDGTINEVASQLVQTKVALGILPMGSGNGLARNLKIPRSLEKALTVIKSHKLIAIDVGSINGRYFFSNTGIGFAANAIANFESSRKRRLPTYLKATAQSIWSYRNNTNYTIDVNGKQQVIRPFLIFISNTNVMGYNFSITRKAILNDGFLDVVIIDKLNRWKILYFGLLFLIGMEAAIKEYSYQKIKTATIKVENPEFGVLVQIDGELKTFIKKELPVDIHRRGLNVIGPYI